RRDRTRTPGRRDGLASDHDGTARARTSRRERRARRDVLRRRARDRNDHRKDLTMLEGRVAIVTGAGRGLGRAEALELARQGATVVVQDFGTAMDGSGSNADPSHDVVKEIEAAGGKAVAHFGDIADYSYVQGLVAEAVEKFGDVNIVVNNAGILRDRMI